MKSRPDLIRLAATVSAMTDTSVPAIPALGPDAARVHFVAMSVDPVNDTPESVRAFTADHRLTTNWHCLIGDRSRLEIVWALYGVGAFTFCTPHARARYLSATEDGRHSEA